MTCTAEIRRSYTTRDEAFKYLAARGFLCTARGWENGRWAAFVENLRNEVRVTVWLRCSEAA